MFRLILLAAIIYILSRWLRRGSTPAKTERASHPRNHEVEEMVQDPVCGTWIPASQALTLSRENAVIYFCSSECREKFMRGPEQR